MLPWSWTCTLCVSVCIQSDDTDGTTANEDEVLHQQPNNTRATLAGSLGTGSKQNPRELSLSSKARCSKLNAWMLTFYLCMNFLLICVALTPMSAQGEAVWRDAASTEAGAQAATRRASEAHRNPRQNPGPAVGLPWPTGSLHTRMLRILKQGQAVYCWCHRANIP